MGHNVDLSIFGMTSIRCSKCGEDLDLKEDEIIIKKCYTYNSGSCLSIRIVDLKHGRVYAGNLSIVSRDEEEKNILNKPKENKE